MLSSVFRSATISVYTIWESAIYIYIYIYRERDVYIYIYTCIYVFCIYYNLHISFWSSVYSLIFLFIDAHISGIRCLHIRNMLSNTGNTICSTNHTILFEHTRYRTRAAIVAQRTVCCSGVLFTQDVLGGVRTTFSGRSNNMF